MKILVAVPTFETITPETFKSIYDLDRGEHEVGFEFVKGYDTAKARNMIVKKALDGGYDRVLMVDSDMIVPPETLTWFLETPVPIISGACPRKNTRKKEAVLIKFGTGDFWECYRYDELTEDRMRIKGCGCACIMIDVEVFRRMDFPWFKYVTYDEGHHLSEDYYFCAKAQTEEFEIWADTRVRCGHLARYFQYE